MFLALGGGLSDALDAAAMAAGMRPILWSQRSGDANSPRPPANGAETASTVRWGHASRIAAGGFERAVVNVRSVRS